MRGACTGEARVPPCHLTYSELAAEAAENYVEVLATAKLAQVRERDLGKHHTFRGPMEKVTDLMHKAEACTLILGKTR